MSRLFQGLLIIGLVFTAGCQGLLLPSRTSAPTFAPSIPTLPATAIFPQLTLTPTPGKPTPGGPVTLRLWLPPQFDPASGKLDGDLLQKRLAEFIKSHPDVKLDVRIKAVEGSGGILDALSAASASAPLALPDLVAMPRPILEAAALKGLLHPFDGISIPLEDPEWYDYARQLSLVQKSTFGLPFAGDALLLIYRPSRVNTPPRDLAEALTMEKVLAFPAADPQALFTLTFYQAAGGLIQDEQGRPTLDAVILTEVLTGYQTAELKGVFPDWLTQLETDDQAWAAFQDQRADLVITWATRYLSNSRQSLTDSATDYAAAPLPTLNGTPYTLATGWVWALASNQPEKQALATELAIFLTEPNFLAEWSTAAGYLPTNTRVLAAWTNAPLQALTSQIALSAHLYPSTDLLSSLAHPLRQATLQILSRQGDPNTLAQTAVDRLINP